MITPRLTRLVRVPDLQAMHRAVDDCAATSDPLHARSCGIVVSTTGAGESLRRTLETLRLERGRAAAFVLPEIVTRTDLYARLHAHLPGAPPMLSEFGREVLFRRAARIASEGGAPAPFSLRPGLIAEILSFYDELRRRHRTVADFDRLITDSLAGSVDIDRGAERMMRQTRFLTHAFEDFERLVRASGAIDEHALRSLLIQAAGPPAFRHLVVTVADQAADPLGLWAADYDLLARLPGVERIDVVATENMLAAGFHQRIHDQLPGIEENKSQAPASTPLLIAPQQDPALPVVHWFTCRDREEELADVARRVKSGESTGRVAVVFQRPLPYLYLARNVFAEAQIPYEAVDSLPLAAEPFAAALDLVFTAIVAEATRASLLELLRSPHWRFTPASEPPLDVRATAALDVWLQRSKYLGGWGRIRELASSARVTRTRERAEPAITVAIALTDRLQTLSAAANASAQLRALLEFIKDFKGERAEGACPERAEAAILSALEGLALAHEIHDDTPMDVADLAGTVRRWIEGQTFSPRTGTTGIALLDAAAAAYADADEVRLVGLVDSDWPDRSRRSIFYPLSLLSQLGWPLDSDRLAAARARFHDLLRLARDRVSLSTFTLESDAIVPASPFLEDVESSGLVVERRVADPAPRVFTYEALAELPTIFEAVEGPAAEWLALRASRSSLDTARFQGSVGVRDTASHAVSHLERYLDCPFKYFAQHVLSLEEERDDESVLTPLERGQLLHEVFEQFFEAWRAAGRKEITASNLPDALELFEQIADIRLATLSETDRALERTYLLGSAAASGLAGRGFAFEIEHGASVLERLLEYPLDGEFEFAAGGESRRLKIRAKADRIDLLEDGSLRIIDYKLGRAPKPARVLQLPIYGVCATQHLAGRHGRNWQLSRAGYVAFRERNAFVPLGGSSSLETALEDGQQRLLTTVAAIERGEFPVDPDEPFLCTRCGYAAVCRKDYVGDE